MKHQHQNNERQQRQNSGHNILNINMQDNNWSKQKRNTPIERNNSFTTKELVTSTRPIMYNDDRDDQ
jgi:hypothetical protein